MKLNHITGNSYYLDGDSAVGVYVFSDQTCLLVDSGPGEARARKILDVLDQEGLQVHAIFSTHSHADHCGGNAYIQARTDCIIMASAMSAAVIENPLLGPAMLYSAYPLRVLTNRALMLQPSKVEQIIQPGVIHMKNEEFEILDLPGHSIGQLGIVNPDGVAFLGDSLMHEEKLAEYPFVYMVDIDSQLQTLEYIKQNCWPWVFLTHGGLVNDLQTNVNSNQQRINDIINQILQLKNNTNSREQVVAQMIQHYHISVNSGQYYLVSSTVAAFLSYLCQHKKLRSKVEDGVMMFTSLVN